MRFKISFAVSALALSLAMPAFADLRPIDFEKASRPAKGFVVLPVGKDGALTGLAKDADKASNGALSKALGLAKFTGETGQTLTLYDAGPFDAVLFIGTGEGLQTATDLRDYGAHAASGTKGWAESAKVVVPDAGDVALDATEAAIGARLGSYTFGKWGAAEIDDADAAAPQALIFLSPKAANAEAAFQKDGEAALAGVTFARDLISTPSNIKTPEWFAQQVQEAFAGMPRVTVTVLDEKQIEDLGMGALYGTGQGSTRPPRLVAIEYKGGKDGDAPIAFVGKGITFDTGGISIKPNDGMWRMRSDMSGAAGSAGAILTLARREAKVNAVAVLALAENMPDGNAIRPGDVLTSMSGKTIEVLNTDAEGRLVLADGLWWAQETYKPKLAVTIATLTGAVVGALGREHAGLFTQDERLAADFLKAGDAVGEKLWRLPVTEATTESIKSDIADVKNIAESGAAPGASAGAAFIMEWVQPETPFVHLDIAGMAWENAGRPTEPKGAVGFGVRLFDEIARQNEAN
ncbi:leucyl aminopeptidase [Hyphomonas sp.]|uniref:leucyl aminopeptidase n=1 Tax=Hyphomonas sp. TaxID=87 RepID=UPI000B006BDC|nr:leucyl aminopeptidase [Hyphomonas sp.]